MATYPTDVHAGTTKAARPGRNYKGPGKRGPGIGLGQKYTGPGKRGFTPPTEKQGLLGKLGGILDFGLTDAERDAQLQRTIEFNNQEMARMQAKRAAAAQQTRPIAPVYRPQPTTGPGREYQIPDRQFTWETTPQEQALMATAMERPDLARTMLTGQYGPLAGQQYQYQGGRTAINYGPGGGGGYPVGGLHPWQTGDYPPWQGQPPWQPPVPPRVPPIIGDPPPEPPLPPRIPGEPEGWVPPVDFEVDPIKVAGGMGPFMQWTRAQHQKYYPDDATKAAQEASAAKLRNDFAFEDAKRRSQLPTTPLQDKAAFMARTDANRGRQASVMPDDFGSGNPFADRQRAARLAPNYLTGQAPGSNLWDIGLGQRANFENPAARNFLRTPKRVDDAAIVSPQLRENLMFLGELRASDRPPQLDSTARPAVSPAVTGVDRGLQQAASRVAAQKQRAAVTQSQQREESRGRQEQENRAAAKKQREALESKSRAKAAEKNRVRGLAAEREKAAKAKAADARKKSLQAASAKAMKQAQARARNKKAEASRKKAMGSKNYSAYQARGKR